MQIKTRHFLIREIEEEDYSHIELYSRDAEVMKYLMVWLDNEIMIKDFIKTAINQKTFEKRTEYLFSVDSLSTGEFIGNCHMARDSHSETTAEIGCWLPRLHWGKGFAVEIANALMKFGFSELKLHRIFAKCDELNTRSYRVLEKIGMKYEGTLREHIWLRDHWRSSRYYGILSDEYFARIAND